MEKIILWVDQLLTKLFGSSNERILKKYWKIVNEEVNPLEEKMRSLPDEAFPKMTEKFKRRLEDGETLRDILPEAFAAVREAARRTLNMRHFDVQIIGGIVLHEGKIAEMATGEGKTLVATLAVYLNSLEGKGVHICTANDYLAKRDTQWMGPIYHFMGVSVGCIQQDGSAYIYDPTSNPEPTHRFFHLREVPRKEAYLADATYGTANEFGFDYLRDNMAIRLEDQVQRKLHYAIVDEVDFILIDEARTPLIISGPSEDRVDKYYTAKVIASTLKKGEDYEVKEKENIVILTDSGIQKAHRIAGVKSFYEGDNMDWPHYIEQALRAKELFHRDKDYVIKDGEIIIVDEFTGRMMPGRRWSDGLHQAIEAKENIRIRAESQTLATITLQNYFRMYKKLAGMTGTAATEAAEFEKIYKLEVVVIPTNKPMIRTDSPDVIYGTVKEKFEAVTEEVKKLYEKKVPVLVGTTSIENSEILSRMLRIKGVPHQVLNAKHHEQEAAIIAKAGQAGSVTIATNMAGRGVDILLGDGVAQMGGLHIIGTERHEARRIDNQLRGRAGRQGDPGFSRFYLSLEDDLFRKFAPSWFKPLMQKMGLTNGQSIESKMVTRMIQKAQKNVENYNFEIRKNLLEYDDVMDKQRKVIYSMRQNILESTDIKQTIQECITRTVEFAVDKFFGKGIPEVERDYDGFVQLMYNKYGVSINLEDLKNKSLDEIEDVVREEFLQAYQIHRSNFEESTIRNLERLILLDTIDKKWKDHLYEMDKLRDDIKLSGYAHIDPKLEYKRGAVELFDVMMRGIWEETALKLFRATSPEAISEQNLIRRWRPTNYRKDEVRAFGETMESQQGAVERPQPVMVAEKIGRNAPCPCGSGKKYKRCCGR